MLYYFIFISLIFIYQIVIYLLHSTLALSFNMDVVLIFIDRALTKHSLSVWKT